MPPETLAEGGLAFILPWPSQPRCEELQRWLSPKNSPHFDNSEDLLPFIFRGEIKSRGRVRPSEAGHSSLGSGGDTTRAAFKLQTACVSWEMAVCKPALPGRTLNFKS